jgi:hypothetical protein
MSGSVNISPGAHAQTASPGPRETDSIYQNNRVVARVEGARLDAESKTFRFDELYNSDYLLLPDECEYQQYRILVRKIEYATKVEKTALHKGRILRGVTAEIRGYREQ